MVFSKNTKNFLHSGHSPQTLPQWGGGYPLPTKGIPPLHSQPPRRLRHLDPSHSKILGIRHWLYVVLMISGTRLPALNKSIDGVD